MGIAEEITSRLGSKTLLKPSDLHSIHIFDMTVEPKIHLGLS